jgi:hypothetical protein
VVGDFLAVEVLDARDRGEWPFFLAQWIAFFYVLKAPSAWSA